MRKLLLTTFALIPFAAVPAFAGDGGAGFIVGGAGSLSSTSATSTAGVSSEQGTMAGAKAGGNGAVIAGAVSGNYTSVNTSALGKAGPAGSYTNTAAQQVNVGGTVAGALGSNQKGTGASGSQNSQASGGASATASSVNGTMLLGTMPGRHGGGPG